MDAWSGDQYSAYDLASMNTFEGQYQAEQQGIPAQTCSCNNCKRKYPQRPRPRMETNDIMTRESNMIHDANGIPLIMGTRRDVINPPRTGTSLMASRVTSAIEGMENNEDEPAQTQTASTINISLNPMTLFFIFVLVIFLGCLRGWCLPWAQPARTVG